MNYQDLKGFLPKKILDAHVHFFRQESLPADYVVPEHNYKRKFNLHFGWPEYLDFAKKNLPEQELSVNCFGNPDKIVNRDNADDFTGSFVDGERCFGLSLVSPQESAEAVLARMRRNHLIGYKPYQSLVMTGKPTADIEVNDLLSPEQLEMADHYRWVITCHIPRKLRLADELNMSQMEAWVKRYPNIKFIFAHIGRAYFLNCIRNRIERFADYGNCFFDTAMVNNDRVLEYAFRHFPLSRLVFGTDAPISMLLGKSVEINDQYLYMMGQPNCDIGTALDSSGSAITFTTFYYEQLNGIMVAAESAGLTPNEIKAFFYDNAYNLLKEAYKWLN